MGSFCSWNFNWNINFKINKLCVCVDMSKLLLLTKNKTINNNKLQIIFINWNKVEQLNKT